MSPKGKAFAPRAVPGLARPRKPRLPTVAERVLANGLRVVAVRRPSVPVVHVRLRVPTAVRRDEDLARSAMLERGMLLGTAERSQGDLAEALQRIGGSLRVSGDADRLVLAGESLRTGLKDLLALLADQLRRAMSQPGVIADEAWLRQLYGDHVYGREHPGADEVLDVPATSLR